MFLNIKNIGKIQDSTIEMNGITVIAGENNTGKSTFGKVLYCMFNAFYNADKTIYNERVDSIRKIVDNNLVFDEFQTVHLDKKVMDTILALNKSFSANTFRKVLVESASKISEKDIKYIDKIINTSIDDIKHSVTIANDDIQKIIVNRYFHWEFSGQINHINRPDFTGNVVLTINGKNIEVAIINNQCSTFSDNVGILYDALYIDTPFVLDDAQRLNLYSLNIINHRNNLIYRIMKETENTVIAEAIIKQKMNIILKNINTIINGDFKKIKNDLLFFEHGMQKSVELSNISVGIKVFLLIKRLLENGEIKERGILIFDEPEIHLHPEWQVQFAEILVLLQRAFNLTILLTTHSPYFLNAVEVYSKKYGINAQCNYYLAETHGDIADVHEVTGNVDKVYKQLAVPFQKLEDISYEG
jgi:predicted ATPase